ncbi:MAG: RNA-guided endonuclease IscB [Candidatus Tectomicrobia bacterium]|nr:RNA-guided endonuclease IscB [Candidatus Tectomicrobia bacterium]
MSNAVLVISSAYKPLKPIHPAVARRMLQSRQAAVFRRYPFTLICKSGVTTGQAENVRLKIDPGSKTTGLALLVDDALVWGAELKHRGQQIQDALEKRRSFRRGRRSRKTRYRKPRFDNRRRCAGWLPPSLLHRVETTMTWVQRLCRYAPVCEISVECVRFDMQLIRNPDIEGVDYQQGELWQQEVRQYVFTRAGYACAYCGAKHVPLELEHIIPRSKGGSNAPNNLTASCVSCNQAKGNESIETFLKTKPSVLARIRAQLKAPLKDAAAVNATRWRLGEELCRTGHPVEAGTGGQTAWNRKRQGLPKTHWVDAACVGQSTPDALHMWVTHPLQIVCAGHSSRRMCLSDKYGFPRTSPKGSSQVQGFKTGDIVRAVVPSGKKAGIYVGRVAVRSSGSFNIQTPKRTVQGIGWKCCMLVHRADGYLYSFGASSSML